MLYIKTVIIPAIVNLAPAKRMVDATPGSGISNAEAVFIAGVALPQRAQQSSAMSVRIMGF